MTCSELFDLIKKELMDEDIRDFLRDAKAECYSHDTCDGCSLEKFCATRYSACPSGFDIPGEEK